MKKKLLLIGGGYADIPLILAAKRLGFYVLTSGNKPNEFGHRYSDDYQNADFSNPDAVLDVAQKNNIQAVCACCNDFSALSAAYVADKMNLPGHDPFHVAMTLHHKDKYREFASQNDILTPKAQGFVNQRDALEVAAEWTYPALIKPVDLTGGKGISMVQDASAARQAISKAFSISKAKRVIMEEFIQGSRHGFSTFLREGKVVFFFSDNEHYYKNPYLVSAASVPSTTPNSAEKKLCSTSEKIAGLLGLVDGIFHIQYILSDGEPIIIEICRRPPGDLYIKLVELATGVDYPSWLVKAEAGLDCSGLCHVSPMACMTRHCVMSAGNGIIKDVKFD